MKKALPVALVVLAAAIIFLLILKTAHRSSYSLTYESMPSTLDITSSAFAPQAALPAKYTCDAENVNPPLRFGSIPAEAKSLVLIVDDPDAPSGTWDHWIMFDIPPQTREIGENSPIQGSHGKGSAGSLTYEGPCPPSGTHRYVFSLYALDSVLGLPEGSSKKAIQNAMEGHILARGELVGVYSRGTAANR